MRPFFFGDSNQSLYGVLHTPTVLVKKPKAALLCYPFGQEYMLAHRAYRQLAMLLTKQGYHVLRFDYRGTGDSSGDLVEVDCAMWMEDVAVAANELIQSSAAEKATIIGLRMGALICAHVADEIDCIDRVVLWDPVISGLNYEEELLQDIAQNGESRSSYVDTEGDLYFNGFCLSNNFRNSIKNKKLSNLSLEAQRKLLIVSGLAPQYESLKKAWENEKGFHFRHTPAPGNWNYVDNFGGILIPQPVIQGVVSWIVETED